MTVLTQQQQDLIDISNAMIEYVNLRYTVKSEVSRIKEMLEIAQNCRSSQYGSYIAKAKGNAVATIAQAKGVVIRVNEWKDFMLAMLNMPYSTQLCIGVTVKEADVLLEELSEVITKAEAIVASV